MQIDWWETKAPDGEHVQEFRINRSGKRDITGAVWLPETALKDTLICFGHGASGDRFQVPICSMASHFAKHGYPVLSLDGPVHGLRQVDDGGLAAFIPEFLRHEAVNEMVEEWHVGIDVVRKELKGGRAGLAYFGLSMGTLLGTQMLAERDDLRVAVLGLAGLSAKLPHGPALLESAERVHAPLLFVMQLEDEMIDRDHALALFDSFGSSNKRLHANPGLHANITQEEVDFALDFMRTYVEKNKKTPDAIQIANYEGATS
ncbi:MAG: hypothetical protein V6Z81_08045 [Parvularculales bacterium]